jgi:hypothetical protein
VVALVVWCNLYSDYITLTIVILYEEIEVLKVLICLFSERYYRSTCQRPSPGSERNRNPKEA